MEEATDLQDWELLQSSDAAPNSSQVFKIAAGISSDSDDDGAIKADHFALDPENRQSIRVPLDEQNEEGGATDSDNPSWIDPDSESRYVDTPRDEVSLARMAFSRRNSDGFWSGESSDGERSLGGSENSNMEVGLEGSGEIEMGLAGNSIMEVGLEGSGEIETGLAGNSIMEVGFEGIDAGYRNSDGDGAGNDLGFGEIGGGEEPEMGVEKHDDSGSGESAQMSYRPDSLLEANTGAVSENLSDPSHGGEKKRMVWWVMPFELLKFCVFRVRPIWSISIAAAFVGFVMLGRRLYRMKQKSRNITLKLALDDKKVSQFMVRAVRLNQAFSVVRHVPIIRSLPPAGGLAPWPVLSLR